MKPLKLVMSAFGSYAEKTTVDFDKVNSGIFLIAGDTGAGKTTIFDAITYALYEQTSGGVRDGNMMRSQFADSDVKTYVELTFIYNDKTYKIKRNPEYMRPSKRKTADGMTLELSKVELIMPDGKAFMGKKIDINNKIVEIIGIDKNQFTQIAMIAQGDFLKLLHANSDERKKIFSKIFDTKIYSKIQDNLKMKVKELNSAIEKNKTICERELNNVKYMENSLYKDEWQNLIKSFEFNSPDILEMIEKINNEIINEENEYLTLKTNNTEKLNEINNIISNAKTVNNLFDKMDKAIAFKEKLDESEMIFNKKRERLEILKRFEIVKIEEDKYNDKLLAFKQTEERIKSLDAWLSESELKLEEYRLKVENCVKLKNEKELDLTQSITRIKDSLDKYDELETCKKSLEQLQVNRDECSKDIKKYKFDIEILKLKINELTEQQENLKNCYQLLADTKIEVNKLEKQNQDIEKLNNSCKDIDRLKKLYEDNYSLAKKAYEEYNQKNAEYESCYRDFLNEQAGILAKEKLNDNMPCPVCGSIEHPDIAKLSENAPSQADVEFAKKQRDIAEKGNRQANERLLSIKQEYSIKNEQIITMAKEVIAEDFVLNNDIINKLNDMLSISKENLKQNYENLINANSNIKVFEKNKQLIEQLNDNYNLKNTELEEFNTCFNNINTNIEKITVKLDELKKQLVFDSKANAINKIKELQSELDMLNQSVENANLNYNTLSKNVELRRGQKESEQQNSQRLNEELKVLYKAYHVALKTNNFEDEKSYTLCKEYKNDTKQLEAEIIKFEQDVSKIQQALNIYQEQLEGKIRINIDDYIKEKNVIEIELQKIEISLKSLYSIKSNNLENQKSLNYYFKLASDLEATYNVYNSLSVTANGNISGKMKMDFETFIQRQYFDKIINAANKRLVRMTSSQFILQCRELSELGNRGPVGLDLDVYSLVTDSTRDIKTLSGGESFMAALSMALGLADVIQAIAGAVHLDTMFIDEGFGSLDDNSRVQAITVLNELAGNNRLVGIISHVNELKEQIDNKLVVKKTDNGSSISWDI